MTKNELPELINQLISVRQSEDLSRRIIRGIIRKKAQRINS